MNRGAVDGNSLRRRASRWLLFLLAGSLSCAYYNTFFVARKSFHAAEASVAASRTERLPSDAERNYEVAIAQSRKVLENHSKSRWVDDAIYLMAASYYGKGEYDSSLIRLAELSQRFPKSPYEEDALFLSGMCATKQRDYDEATRFFDQILQEHPKYERTDEILFTQAETAAARRDRRGAIHRYGALVERYPKSRRSEEALRRVGELHFEAGRYDSASLYFDRLVRTGRDEELRFEATILQAKTLTRTGHAEEALRLLESARPSESETTQPAQTVDRTVPIGEQIPRIRLEEAAALNALDRHDEAIATLRTIVTRYGSSPQAVEAQFQVGYTYETLDSLDAARAAYDKVGQVAGRSIFKEQAVQRSAALRTLSELQQKEGSGDQALEGRADAALRIAEIFYLDRGLAADAVEKYKKIEEEFPETRAAPRAAYALAYMRWKVDRDSLGAQEQLRDLIHQYPASTQARGALDLLAEQGADTAGLASVLVALAPDTLALADSLAATAGPDSLGVADSTSTPGVDSLDVPVEELPMRLPHEFSDSFPPDPERLRGPRRPDLEREPGRDRSPLPGQGDGGKVP